MPRCKHAMARDHRPPAEASVAAVNRSERREAKGMTWAAFCVETKQLQGLFPYSHVLVT